MTAITRLGAEGYGVKRAGSFAGKTPGTAGGPHPVSIITRLSADGYGVRRYLSFAGKTGTVVAPVDTGTILMPGPVGKYFSRKRWREFEEQEAADRRAILAKLQQERDAAERVKLDAQAVRVAKLQARADRAREQAAVETELAAAAKAEQANAQLAAAQADYQRALALAIAAFEDDEDDVIMLLLGL